MCFDNILIRYKCILLDLIDIITLFVNHTQHVGKILICLHKILLKSCEFFFFLLEKPFIHF